MFCPKCRAEYREGFTECADCKVPLVSELPPEPKLKSVKLITVFSAGDPAGIAMAKSILEAAEIQYAVKSEGVQDLFGAGRIGPGFNPLVGPTEIQVGKDDEEEARKLLKDLVKE